MSLSAFMTKEIISLEIDDNLSKAKQAFDKYNIHHILIKNGKELSGIITDRDLYKHLSPNIGTKKETPKDTFLLSKKINLIMSRELITAKENTSLNDAVLLFHDHHISCLPIVDDHFRPIGIISWRDIIKIIALQYRMKLANQHN
ncbi:MULTISPECIES: CBS domain-containing protein [Thalassotalea]|uniref:CBS domain-containing protein n=1 Tax=Thalassotalea castellviae TaxID=3075612 RepID=A0ABU2ZZP4_9GAMM|nr:CBS domain-containing protein [Thalassotalea sp. W431]MDT0603401.1 CBS domain-containing protein [Thalassotalea sp. W431]